jgi:hypothetical protein
VGSLLPCLSVFQFWLKSHSGKGQYQNVFLPSYISYRNYDFHEHLSEWKLFSTKSGNKNECSTLSHKLHSFNESETKWILCLLRGMKQWVHQIEYRRHHSSLCRYFWSCIAWLPCRRESKEEHVSVLKVFHILELRNIPFFLCLHNLLHLHLLADFFFLLWTR